MKHLLLSFIAFLFLQGRAQSANDSLLLYMPFNGNANDESGNGNNGVIHNNVTPVADRNGRLNAAYNFDGVSSYIEIPASPSMAKIYTSKEITISAWVNIRNWYQSWNVFAIFEQYDPTTDYGSILLEANWVAGGILFESGYNADYIGCDYSWSFNTWHNVAVTYSAPLGVAKFYVDGVLTCTKPYTQNFTPDTVHSFAIGRSLSGPDEYSDGVIDELRIYNKVLTPAEITALPLNLTSFTAEYKKGMAVLQWKASDQINVSHFDVERSGDGRAFEKIGVVPISAGADYSFNDLHVETNQAFYRLKVVDADGKYKYSKIVRIDTKYVSVFNVYPNPAKGQVFISGIQNGATIKLLSIDGRLIKQFNTTANMKIDISGIAKGTYLIQYINKNESQSRLLLKQ